MIRTLVVTATLTALAVLLVTVVPHHLSNFVPQYPRIDLNNPHVLFH